MKCPHDTDGDGNCPVHPKGCPPVQPPATMNPAVAYLTQDELQTISDLAATVQASKQNVGFVMKGLAKEVADIVAEKEAQQTSRDGNPLRRVPHAE